MDYAEIVARIAPCGLDCGRYAAYAEGEIKGLAVRLIELLKGYDRVAKIREATVKEFKGYPDFVGVLEFFTRGNCGGCRSDTVECPIDCKPRECAKEKRIDFCYQCDEYGSCAGPSCSRWRAFDDRMKEIGVSAFFDERLKTQRY